jgi:predicted HAD superfamily phosphohydrolase YqeG
VPELLGRAAFTLARGFSRRGALARILRSPGCARVTEVAAHCSPAAGGLILVLDFDGVLAPHGYDAPLPAVDAWLRECAAAPGIRGVTILSNKPTRRREAYFAEHHPGVRFVTGVRKKPYPDALLALMAADGAEPRQIVVVDDRLLTGILAGVLAGTQCVYVTPPLADFSCRTASEILFALVRGLERLLVRLAPAAPGP